ncbi:MAG: hypothetical protein KA248_13015 [Kiritimatiellae bacterium]|nr:hypothetical protein [Kiritimatiellia bacterium]
MSGIVGVPMGIGADWNSVLPASGMAAREAKAEPNVNNAMNTVFFERCILCSPFSTHLAAHHVESNREELSSPLGNREDSVCSRD